MRDYIPPVIPSEWTGSRKRFALMLKETLDELHEPIREEWLSNSLRDMVSYGGKSSVRDYSTTPQSTGAKWIDGRNIFKVTVVGYVQNDSPHVIDIDNIDSVIAQEGFIVGTSGSQKPIGEFIYVSKQSENSRFRIVANNVSGTAYVTIYYVLSESE